MRYARAFGLFWYDFIVGDSVALAVGGAGALVVGAILVHAGATSIAEVALPGIVVATLVWSVRPVLG